MPCSTCIPASKTSYNVSQSYQTSHPGKVLFYLCDDYANTSCASVNSWANSNSIPASATSRRFSNAAINMTHYGTTGMPKIVVVGGNNHKVYYNSNNTVNATELQSAINAALNANNIEENEALAIEINLFPNPANDMLTLSLNTDKKQTLNIQIIEVGGKLVYNKSFDSESGLNEVTIDTKAFANGSYVINVTDNNRKKSIRFNIAH